MSLAAEDESSCHPI